jgi:hypothetical protein
MTGAGTGASTRRSEPGAARRSTRALPAAVAVSVTLTAIHGAAHGWIPVPLATWQQGYAAVVLVGLPLGGATLVRLGRPATGAGVALVGGLGALAFEVVAHFVVENPDHVASVATGRTLFAGTAGLSVIGDAVLVAVAGRALRAQAQGSSARSCSDSTT